MLFGGEAARGQVGQLSFVERRFRRDPTRAMYKMRRHSHQIIAAEPGQGVWSIQTSWNSSIEKKLNESLCRR
jgi:hypothetical protein